MNTVNAKTARIAIEISIDDEFNGIEAIMTRFVRPEKLKDALLEIADHKAWIITQTYLADQHGQRLEA